MSRLDPGGLLTGLFFTVVGLAFILEATGVWAFQLTHLRFVGPLALVLVGVGLVLTAGNARRIR